MEKAVFRKTRSKFSIHIQDVLCAGASIILGFVASPIGYALAFLYVAYSYLRSTRESFIVVFFVLLCALARGVLPAYLYALGFTSFFVIVHMVKVCNGNLYGWMPYITTLISIPFSLQGYWGGKEAIILPILVYLIMQQLMKDYTWIRKSYVLSESMYAILIFAGMLLTMEAFPNYQSIVLLIAFVFLTFIADAPTVSMLAVCSYFLLNVQDPVWLLFLCVLSIFKKNRKSSFLIIGAASLLLAIKIEDYILLCACLLSLFLLKEGSIKLLTSAQTQPILENRLSQNSILKRQMQNYASIFQSLSEYYAQISGVQADILSNMSSALQYNADIIRKIDGYDHDKVRIQRALEGYQYEIIALEIEEPREGFLQITMDIQNIKRGEIKTTLMPLLEALLHRKLVVEGIRSRGFASGFHHICIGDHIPFTIDAYADSVKNAYTSSGDTFSIFRFRQSLVCMISDGMGNGERAAQSSRLITNVFQRMMVSGIPQDAAIKCINKLIQSDTFATLDVLCFNYAQGVSYISKSAACPTYLLREKQVYEVSGNALPVGIISQMQPYCFQLELKAGDEYLMVSDGIFQDEIYTWMKERKHHSTKEDVEIFKAILQKSRRKDDSTIILASVNETV